MRKQAETANDCSRQGICVREFQPHDKEVFRRLNEEWITRYFRIEEKDRQLFDDPEGCIIANGGMIFVLELHKEPVGCCALMNKDDETFEVAKMAVTENHQGKGFGKMLLETCIARARSLGKKRLFIETNSKLQAAITLYRKLGFVKVQSDKASASDYTRADVFLELKL